MTLLTAMILFCILETIILLYVFGTEIKKRDKKYNDYCVYVSEQNNIAQNQYIKYEDAIENLGGIIESQEVEIENLKQQRADLKTKIRYRNKRINDLEFRVSKYDKKVLRGRKFN